VDERFYHPTGGESYYFRKKKFKKFFYTFFTTSVEPSVTSESNGPRWVDSLRRQYETLWSLGTEAVVSWPRSDRSGGLASRAEIGGRNSASGEACGVGCPCPAAPRMRVSPRLVLLLLLFAAALPLAGREKNKLAYGEGLAVNIPAPESEVEQVVADVADNGLIRGTKEYNKDEFVSGAKAATSSRVFSAWTEGGKVFYKVREQALDPRNFKDSSDSGTLVVRYVVQAQGEKNTVLRINALFKEDFRHIVHQSDGSVENAEYRDIREHIDAIELMKRQNVEALNERREKLEKKQTSSSSQTDAGAWPVPQSEQPAVAAPVESHEDPAPTGTTQVASQSAPDQSQPVQNQPVENQPVQSQPGQDQPGQTLSSQSVPVATASGQSLEEHVKDLRRQLERQVKDPGAPLKSAPFHTASTLQSLPTGTEVLILISTPYWYGVETHEGQHGWIMRDDLVQK
jgi:hypothetical protein